jgi:acyl-CoA reductase-like NAD-dependent aldehyde dehydrogenase
MNRAEVRSEPANVPLTTVQNGELVAYRPLDLSAQPPLKVTPPEQVKAAVERSRQAQRGWAARSFDDRVALLTRAAKDILARRAEVLELMRADMGKLEVDALMSEVLGPLDQVSSWAAVIGPEIARKRVGLNPINFPRKKAYVDRVPRGVIGIIAPWNYPVATLFRTLIPALLSGNGVVLKPSEHATRTERWFADVLAEKLPPGLVSVVIGDRATGVALIEAGIDACVFTGSVNAGRDVARRCGERFIPTSIEMGGKDGAIVLDDCELDRTLAGLTHWTLHNVGQACGAIEVAYVDRRIADVLVERLASAWRRLKVGPGAPGEVDISPLANAKQLALVEAHVEDAKKKGGKLLCGGKRLAGPSGPMGLFYEPTLLDHCTPDMDVVREETFGPVLAIVRVDGAAEAMRLINACRYGLTASIWTADLARAERLAEELEVGVVTINNHAVTGAMAALPWSGHRDTGPGVANSTLALSTFLRPKTVLVDRNDAPELYWMPYDKTLWKLGNLLADAQLLKIGQAYKIPFLIKERIDTVRAFFSGRA